MKAFLHIKSALRNGCTVLPHTYFAAPFKMVDVSGSATVQTRRLMIMNASPGVLDGDEYSIKVELADGTSLNLETQSYQRLFCMEKGAQQQMEVHLGTDARFTWLPHPSVPHRNAKFTAINRIYMGANSSLVWGEVLTAGRMLLDEQFCFSWYQNKTEIFQAQKLVVKDNLFLAPDRFPVQALGNLEGYTHQASLFCIGPNNDWVGTELQIHALLQEQVQFASGISRLPVPGVVVRLLGHKAEPMHRCLQQIATLVQASPITKTAYGI